MLLLLFPCHQILNSQNNEMFMDELRTKFKIHTSYLSMYAPQTYDAVWAIALALRGAQQHFKTSTNLTSNNKGGSKSSSDKSSNSNYLKLDRFDYTRQDMAYEFLKQLGTLNFLGVSVSLYFYFLYFVNHTLRRFYNFYSYFQYCIENLFVYFLYCW